MAQFPPDVEGYDPRTIGGVLTGYEEYEMPTSFQQFIGGAGDVLYPGIDLEPLSTAFDLYSSNPDPNLYSVIQQGLGLAQQLVSARRAQDLPGTRHQSRLWCCSSN